MKWIVCIHSGAGSMVEGSDSQVELGPYDTMQDAEAAGDTFYNALTDQYLKDDTWYTVVGIPTARPDPVAEARKYEFDRR